MKHTFRSLVAAAGLTLGLLGGTGSLLAQTSTPAECAGLPTPHLQAGFKAVVTPGSPNNLRSYYGLKQELVGTLQPGTVVDVYEGPFCADGYVWWQVAAGNDFGYTVEAKGSDYFLVPYQVTPLATEQAGTVTVNDHNVVHFSFDSSIAPAVAVETLPEVPATADGPGWGIAPSGIQYTFFDGTENSSYPESTLVVYPADGFGNLDMNTGKELDALSLMIKTQSVTSKDQVPEVPIINAAQVIRAGVKYLTLPDGGKGVRFLTWYAQDLSVAANGNLRYEFRGFNADGSEYISAQFKLTSPDLPDEDTLDYQAIADKFSKDGAYDQYLADITAQLTNLPSDHFTPNLDLLDAAMQSISFTK